MVPLSLVVITQYPHVMLKLFLVGKEKYDEKGDKRKQKGIAGG